MKRNGDSTPLSESNTNGERSWLNFPDMDTNLWAEIQWLENQSQRPSTPTPATLPKAFHKEPGYMPSRGRQSMLRCLWPSGVAAQLAAPGFQSFCRPSSFACQHSTTAKIFLVWLLAVQKSKCVLYMLMREECHCGKYISNSLLTFCKVRHAI